MPTVEGTTECQPGACLSSCIPENLHFQEVFRRSSPQVCAAHHRQPLGRPVFGNNVFVDRSGFPCAFTLDFDRPPQHPAPGRPTDHNQLDGAGLVP